jgi:energy-converting hydrogenase Eha subunit A
MTGTVSASYAVALYAIARLSFGEAAILTAAGALAQTVWKPKRRPSVAQIAFNCACFVVSAAAAFAMCRLMLDPLTSRSVVVMLCVGAPVLYLVNSILVAVILCLLDNRPLLDVWQLCNFWVLPYYMAGTTAVALMIASEKAAGWPAALGVIPLLALLWTSYREHVWRSRPVMGA